MRIDKYLKISRIIKRRTVAKEFADNGRVEINSKIAKSSSTVKVNDLITINLGHKSITIKVIRLVDTTKKDEALMMYTLLKEEAKRNQNETF